jgi:peptide deformylase
MILPIVVYGNPILRKISENITPNYPNVKELIDNMFETMYRAEGVGLAAPQVGLNIRLFVVDTSPMHDENEPEPKTVGIKKAFINAKILEYWGEEWAFNEGCLSLPEIREDVYRPSEIKIEYDDENFVHHIDSFSGNEARVIQHEYDHIDGKLFVDKVNPLRRRFLGGKLRSISSGKIQPPYKIKL